jgi:hypothetical protein
MRQRETFLRKVANGQDGQLDLWHHVVVNGHKLWVAYGSIFSVGYIQRNVAYICHALRIGSIGI